MIRIGVLESARPPRLARTRRGGRSGGGGGDRRRRRRSARTLTRVPEVACGGRRAERGEGSNGGGRGERRRGGGNGGLAHLFMVEPNGSMG